MSRTCPVGKLLFAEAAYDRRVFGLKTRASTQTPWRFLWNSVNGHVEAWELSDEGGGYSYGVWAYVTVIPQDTPLDIVEQTLRAMARLKLDTGP